MNDLPSHGVHHTICDPPFASEIYQRCKKNPARQNGSDLSSSLLEMVNGRIGTLDDVLELAAGHIARLTQRWALIFCDVESVSAWRAALEANGMRYMRCGAWVKQDPMPQFSGDRPAQGFEACVIAHSSESKPRWNGRGKAAIWHHQIVKGAQRPDHPCPKPLALMEELVDDFTDPGDIVLDPFAGSGTTLVACKRFGRNGIGWEKDPTFHAAAVKRIDAARQQYELLPRPPKAKQTRLLP